MKKIERICIIKNNSNVMKAFIFAKLEGKAGESGNDLIEVELIQTLWEWRLEKQLGGESAEHKNSKGSPGLLVGNKVFFPPAMSPESGG